MKKLLAPLGCLGIVVVIIVAILIIVPFSIMVIILINILGPKEDISPESYDIGNLSPHVLQYESTVFKYADELGIGHYTPVILGIMQQESGGNPSSTDPMQSSESLCGNIGCIKDADHSIKQGVTHFNNVLTKANGDLFLAIHSYNFGSGFIDYVQNKNGTYTLNKPVGDKVAYDLAITFSQEQYQKEVAKGNGGMFSCLRAESKPLKACYGDILYVWSVLQYLNLSDDGDGEMLTNVPSGTFAMPANGQLTSSFGLRIHPITKDEKMHNGIDIGIPRGTPVASSSSGVVVKVQNGCIEGNFSCGGGWGNYVIVRHRVNGSTYETVYAHLTTATAKNGQKVRGGEVIGLSGNTGSSKGAHLHFEVHLNGIKNPVDPLSVVSNK